MTSPQKQLIGTRGLLSWGTLRFAHPALADLHLPYFDIVADAPGPKLAIIAGMHPNEVDAMEAALRLKAHFAEHLLKGSVSIIPVLNMPGLFEHAEFVCPIDGKNMNFLAPGDPAGSFSQVLVHSVLHEWAAHAEVFIDLHGGDLREEVARFVMCQMTGNAEFDQRTRALAHQFDADSIVEFASDQTSNRGRATNELPWLGRHAVMAEGGANGVLDPGCIEFHFQGVANIGRYLGLTDDQAPAARRRNNVVVSNFGKVEAPISGRLYLEVAAGDRVAAGQRLGRLQDIYGDPQGELLAPHAGLILMVVNHPIVNQGEWLISLAPLPG
ncbi:succinylglutamate desuccinylase/aspartoacylase family protein [Pseudomonas sp. HR96]|uniref:succinylglutamate desuccinylase/aspartoacylase family protein n=1 Tax=Pseudomonas sp. HR96 TaxID=1027966 RepID=UPI002A751062|nr:succinylglutamate desuccinylase/aspartoacylase family protein [Pseudomonas sp. HR96]WPP01911.1 succinylglutamate desuccinylase/aspartoacylase family protein [Pseudomonas sp. HR96]